MGLHSNKIKTATKNTIGLQKVIDYHQNPEIAQLSKEEKQLSHFSPVLHFI